MGVVGFDRPHGEGEAKGTSSRKGAVRNYQKNPYKVREVSAIYLAYLADEEAQTTLGELKRFEVPSPRNVDQSFSECGMCLKRGAPNMMSVFAGVVVCTEPCAIRVFSHMVKEGKIPSQTPLHLFYLSPKLGQALEDIARNREAHNLASNRNLIREEQVLARLREDEDTTPVEDSPKDVLESAVPVKEVARETRVVSRPLSQPHEIEPEEAKKDSPETWTDRSGQEFYVAKVIDLHAADISSEDIDPPEEGEVLNPFDYPEGMPESVEEVERERRGATIMLQDGTIVHTADVKIPKPTDDELAICVSNEQHLYWLKPIWRLRSKLRKRWGRENFDESPMARWFKKASRRIFIHWEEVNPSGLSQWQFEQHIYSLVKRQMDKKPLDQDAIKLLEENKNLASEMRERIIYSRSFGKDEEDRAWEIADAQDMEARLDAIKAKQRAGDDLTNDETHILVLENEQRIQQLVVRKHKYVLSKRRVVGEDGLTDKEKSFLDVYEVWSQCRFEIRDIEKQRTVRSLTEDECDQLESRKTEFSERTDELVEIAEKVKEIRFRPRKKKKK